MAAKNPLTEDEQNIELNRKIGQVKQLMEDSALFRKLKEDEFNRLVDTLTNIDATSRAYYEPLWSQYGEKRSMPVMSLKEIMTKSFSLIMEHPDKFREAEKSFVLKLARCYITEAVEAKQNYKLPVD